MAKGKVTTLYFKKLPFDVLMLKRSNLIRHEVSYIALIWQHGELSGWTMGQVHQWQMVISSILIGLEDGTGQQTIGVWMKLANSGLPLGLQYGSWHCVPNTAFRPVLFCYRLLIFHCIISFFGNERWWTAWLISHLTWNDFLHSAHGT